METAAEVLLEADPGDPGVVFLAVPFATVRELVRQARREQQTAGIVLCGGDKGSQRRDIERAGRLAKDWRRT